MQNEVCVDNFSCCNSLNEDVIKVGKYTSLIENSTGSTDAFLLNNNNNNNTKKNNFKSEINEKFNSEDSNSSIEGAYENRAFILSDKSVSSTENQFNIQRNFPNPQQQQQQQQQILHNFYRYNKSEAKNIPNLSGESSNAYNSLPSYLSSSTTSSTSSSSSSSSSSCSLNKNSASLRAKQTSTKTSAKMEAIAKFQQITLNLNSQNQQTVITKCICKSSNEKKFNCTVCTQNYPVNVRRSKDGEEETSKNILSVTRTTSTLNSYNLDNDNKAKHYSNQTIRMVPQQIQQFQPQLSNSSNKINASQQAPTIKPPISSNLLSLLALNKPGNVFIPPPNVSLHTITTFHNSSK